MQRRRTFLSFAAYLTGGAILAALGPSLWSVDAIVATIAASATTVIFMVAHLFIETRQTAERALAEARRRRSELIALGHFVADLEQRLAMESSAAMQPEVAAPTTIDSPVETAQLPDAATNLLQFAARVSANCTGRRSDEGEAVQLAVVDALANGHIELMLQPIVRLPGRQTLHYSASTRLRGSDGEDITDAASRCIAADIELAAELATQQLATVIALLNRIADKYPETRIFCPISAQALQSDRFREELVGFMTSNLQLAKRLAFDLDSATVLALNAEAVADLRELQSLGFAFSVADAELADLGRIAAAFGRIAFARIAAGGLAAADPNAIAAVGRAGTQVIANNVGNAAEAAALREAGICLAAGQLFGAPRRARTDAEPQRLAA